MVQRGRLINWEKLWSAMLAVVLASGAGSIAGVSVQSNISGMPRKTEAMKDFERDAWKRGKELRAHGIDIASVKFHSTIPKNIPRGLQREISEFIGTWKVLEPEYKQYNSRNRKLKIAAASGALLGLAGLSAAKLAKARNRNKKQTVFRKRKQ